MSETEETEVRKPRDWKRLLALGGLILIAAIFSFLNADERIAINLGVAVLYRLSLVGVVFSVFLLGMLTMFLFGLRHDKAVRDALRTQSYRQPLSGRPLTAPRPAPGPAAAEYEVTPATARLASEYEVPQPPARVPGEHEHDLAPPAAAAHLGRSPEPDPPA